MSKLMMVGVVGILAGAALTFAILIVSDDSPSRSEADASPSKPAQYEVVGKGVGDEGQMSLFFVKFHSYGETQEWRGTAAAGRACYDDAKIGDILPSSCR